MPNDFEIIRRNAVAAPNVETHLIEDADHFYAEHELEVATLLARWADARTAMPV